MKLSNAQWVQIHTDGGKESGGASAALTIMVWSGIPDKPKREYINIRAEFIADPITPFHAEALTLLCALQDFSKGLRTVA